MTTWQELTTPSGSGKYLVWIDLIKTYLKEPLIIPNSSLPRRRESSDVNGFWIPVSTGMTFLEVALRKKETEDYNALQKFDL